MKRTLAGLLALLPAVALADRQSSIVEAKVVSAEPIVRVVSERIPHEICREERVRVVERGSRSATPGIVGAVVGGTVAGVLGRNSRYQPVIAGAGAVVGASVGSDIGRRRHHDSYYMTEEVCSVEYQRREREEIDGYRVRYRYSGNIYETRTEREPGRTIPLRVEIQPLS
ncbi:glycine zipper 2TM domain-containing protein [Chromatocurvus halotolerans]|uniref:Uncharacterized protein YcfJ n=1 Tax=Chromatocurvus halotolerans TaxID=1132028 RepID=A0A4V2SBS9_9GAMM|nr:histidine kinase [Chromatocurvus halotolerans]TCO76710.1 uncharacterized protein YcfJ [Chromatocurvus halotolerans]